ncbi:MAG: helix-turn-helix transcriptional regulator [Acidimicrobiia bacterium]|nr:helix-turn-helix transcriptional regulator [Acidimicrobiia bacterium]
MAKTYDQYCPVAAGLDQLGDRWTLLLLRDLVWYGPARFTDFTTYNPGLPPALLTQRLERLTEAGLVEHADGSYRAVDPDGDVRRLIDRLSAFGSRFMGEEKPSMAELEYLATRLTSLHATSLTDVEPRTVVVAIDDLVVGWRIGNGTIAVTPSTDAPTVSLDPDGFKRLVAGVTDPATIAPDPTVADRLRYLRPAA